MAAIIHFGSINIGCGTFREQQPSFLLLCQVKIGFFTSLRGMTWIYPSKMNTNNGGQGSDTRLGGFLEGPG
jgi:hypothetical protein